ncbi:hypothetical protein FISHEDRAFT_66191 [Fistulina hepatica ATCC 64428]|uniref:Uncharacterized protein n=1 Tax=Fistulina hepatica ATCC 64428 TaxID=1128425 RepID=A0A0D7A9J7_9AGAR|nr:hypothetical protein FISHEDRAFT_66191 [Fistulina hepatica ATCC 64428]
MHLCALNLTDLFLGLYHGSSWNWATLMGNIWLEHGQTVADALSCLTGSFDRPPCNPAKRINSGYKAWEFSTYFYSFSPALFYHVLSDLYWHLHCKLVAGIQIIHNCCIPINDLLEAQKQLLEVVYKFEDIYYQQKTCHIHFVHQSIHLLTHLMPIKGWTPGGTLGVNALKALISDLDKHSTKSLPVRLCLINGQIARTAWREKTKPPKNVCMSYNITYFFHMWEVEADVNSVIHTVALVSLFSFPDAELLETSFEILKVCKYMGEESFAVVSVKDIGTNDTTDIYFICEKIGLDVAILAHEEEDMFEKDI